MPSRSEIHYFGAGPAALPTPVLETAAASILNHNNSGLGLLEQSHRSASSASILKSAVDSLTSLLSIPENYSVIFMQGGGTGQFAASLYNLLASHAGKLLAANNGDLELTRTQLASLTADYLVTGSWSKKASQEAQRLLGKKHINIAATASAYTIPAESEWKLTPVEENPLFAYYCDNETIDGVEFPAFPAALEGRNVVCDMSSNILSRAVDVSKYALIFAGAQKNVGPAGVTIVIVRNDILQDHPDADTMRELGLPIPPVVFEYPTIAKAGSLYNTLPIFEVFVCAEVMKTLVERGGLEVQQKVAEEKAALIYGALDESEGFYKVVSNKNNRSKMNICFRIEGGEEVEGRFAKGAEALGLTGVKGHRSVGGLRASNYNCVPTEAAEKLAAWIREFAAKEKSA